MLPALVGYDFLPHSVAELAMSRQWIYRRLESHWGLRPPRRRAEVVTLTDNSSVPRAGVNW